MLHETQREMENFSIISLSVWSDIMPGMLRKICKMLYSLPVDKTLHAVFSDWNS